MAAVVTTAAVCGSIAIAGSAQAAVATDTSALRNAVTVDGIMGHLDAFQAIADADGGTRQAGTPGHEDSVKYVKKLLDDAGYKTWTQEFKYQRTTLLGSSLSQTAPGTENYVYGTDYLDMSFAGGGDVTRPVTVVDINVVGDRSSTSGCEAADFAGFPVGNIALIQRGTCSFGQKVDNAVAAGASGVVIFNQGNGGADRTDLFAGTLGEPVRAVPAVSVSFAQGVAWANTAGLTLHLKLDVRVDNVVTRNLLADTPSGRTDRTVVVGGHLDSVGEGPGINDNGSGTATILETALQMAKLGVTPENRVRFAFWSGEEDGLLGSTYYVDHLTKSEIKGTALNLNFDMIASPNYANFVYDGDGNAFGATGPNGSSLIESVFTGFFSSQGAATLPTAFDGRSDYFGFINAGIPAGGLFTGAEGEKTAEQAALFGGTAGEAFDPCYHQACDTIANINEEALDIMSDAVAHATLTFAETTSAVNGTAKGNGTGKLALEYQGNRAVR